MWSFRSGFQVPKPTGISELLRQVFPNIVGNSTVICSLEDSLSDSKLSCFAWHMINEHLLFTFTFKKTLIGILVVVVVCFLCVGFFVVVFCFF